jgi:hypothetical protein
VITTFTRQLSILQDAGLPIVRSLKILEGNAKPGKLKNALQDVVEEIEGGATLSEGMAKCPKVFNRLYVNMIKAGEAGGALEVILQRLADFMERAEALKRKVKGAMIYPIVVITVAVAILTFIMLKIVPVFATMFDDFGLDLPEMTLLLVAISNYVVQCWFLIPLIPVGLWLFIKLCRKFKHGRMGWDMFMLKLPVFGQLVEKNTMARTTRTLGTLVASGVPILEGIQITRDTSGNAVFERLYGRVGEAIREGEPIAKPLKTYSTLGFHPVALFFWCFAGALPGLFVMGLTPMMPEMLQTGAFLVTGRRRPVRAVVRGPHEVPRGGRLGREHGGRGRRDGRVGHDVVQSGGHLRRRSQDADRQFDPVDGTHHHRLPRRRRRLYRHRPLPAPGRHDRRFVRIVLTNDQIRRIRHEQTNSSFTQRLYAGRTAGGGRHHRRVGGDHHACRLPLEVVRAREARIFIEMNNLHMAVESYRQQHNDYPVDFSSIPRHSAAAARGSVSARQRGAEAFSAGVHQAPGETGQHLCSRKRRQSAGPGRSTGGCASGFNKDPRRPLTGSSEKDGFFDFDPTRLRDVNGNGYPSYFPLDNPQQPYVYFASGTYDLATYPVLTQQPTDNGVGQVLRPYKRRINSAETQLRSNTRTPRRSRSWLRACKRIWNGVGRRSQQSSHPCGLQGLSHRRGRQPG